MNGHEQRQTVLKLIEETCQAGAVSGDLRTRVGADRKLTHWGCGQ
jgi:hypothetical protein